MFLRDPQSFIWVEICSLFNSTGFSLQQNEKKSTKDIREKLRLAKIELGLHLIAAFVSPHGLRYL